MKRLCPVCGLGENEDDVLQLGLSLSVSKVPPLWEEVKVSRASYVCENDHYWTIESRSDAPEPIVHITGRTTLAANA